MPYNKVKGMSLSMEIKRDYYLQKLIDKKNHHLIKVITGIRKCGIYANKKWYKVLLDINLKF